MCHTISQHVLLLYMDPVDRFLISKCAQNFVQTTSGIPQNFSLIYFMSFPLCSHYASEILYKCHYKLIKCVQSIKSLAHSKALKYKIRF